MIITSTRQATRQELIEEVERLRKELNKEKEKKDYYKECLEVVSKELDNIDYDQILFAINDRFISKDKIKEKIKELEKFGAMLDKESTVSQFTANVVSIRYLKDLLKESE